MQTPYFEASFTWLLWGEQLKVGIPTVPVLVRQWHSMFEIVLTKPQFAHVETKKDLGREI